MDGFVATSSKHFNGDMKMLGEAVAERYAGSTSPELGRLARMTGNRLDSNTLGLIEETIQSLRSATHDLYQIRAETQDIANTVFGPIPEPETNEANGKPSTKEGSLRLCIRELSDAIAGVRNEVQRLKQL